MRIVFMGTPDFAVPSLQALIDAGHEVVGVFTQPDKQKGRGHHLMPPPVKILALEHNISVFQPVTFRHNDSVEMVQLLVPELIVVVAYGKILPQSVLSIPPHGCINVHGSLLPKYRGAAPIQWCVLNGETTAGVTTMMMADGIDTGDMLLKSTVEVGPNETASELYARLATVGAALLTQTIDKLDTIIPQPQDHSASSHAPMLSKEQSAIDFTKPAAIVHNQIRGLSEWPCAETMVGGKRLKVYRSCVVEGYAGAPRTLLNRKRLIVGCSDGAIELTEVQYEGSKRMGGGDFLRGAGQKLMVGEEI